MKLVFILPYFGKLKNYFNLFIRSLAYNSNVDLLLITDSAFGYELPKNVRVVNMTFEEFAEHIQSKFDFKICLNTPYKLCDYKPAYGYICEEWIEEYDYWGHCDCDLLFGDLTPVFDLLSDGYDKLFSGGHMTIYKNTKENNRTFMGQHSQNGTLYLKVFGNEKIYAFDEVCYKVNVADLFREANKIIYEEDKSYNVCTKRSMISRNYFDPAIRRWLPEKTRNDQVYWDNGHIYRVKYVMLNRKIDEFIYIHLQSRKMKYNSDLLSCNTIRILPNKFKNVRDLPANIWEYILQIRLYVNYQLIKSSIYSFLHKKDRDRLRYSKPWEYNPYI